MYATRKGYREVERIVKGFANHRRVEILALLANEPDLSVEGIAERLNINFKTASEHIRRIALSGLVEKRYVGRSVHHRLTPRARNILTFLRMLE